MCGYTTLVNPIHRIDFTHSPFNILSCHSLTDNKCFSEFQLNIVGTITTLQFIFQVFLLKA